MSSTAQAPSGATPQYYENRVRLIVFFYRKQGMTQEEFHTYWRETHSKIFGDLPIVRKNLIKYEQIHFYPGGQQTVMNDGFPIADYDGIVVFDAESMEKISEILASKEYKEIVVPDEEKFLDRKRYLAYPSRVVPVFDRSA